jgi:hypothetical protein
MDTPDAPVARTWIVENPGTPVFVTAVAEVVVGPLGELVLEAGDGGAAAVFAPGRWHHARVADDPPEAD